MERDLVEMHLSRAPLTTHRAVVPTSPSHFQSAGEKEEATCCSVIAHLLKLFLFPTKENKSETSKRDKSVSAKAIREQKRAAQPPKLQPS